MLSALLVDEVNAQDRQVRSLHVRVRRPRLGLAALERVGHRQGFLRVQAVRGGRCQLEVWWRVVEAA